MRVEAVALEEARVVARDHGNAAQRGGVQRERIERIFAIAPGAGEFEVQAFAGVALPV